RSPDRPVAARYAPTVALSPDVEKCGLVLPSLKPPHSGCPAAPQPFGSLVSPSRSDQPIALPGQPSASAIGRGMASTSGVCAIEAGFPSGTGLPLSEAAAFCRSRDTQEDAAGVHTCGAGVPIARSSQPAARASIAAPDALLTTLTLAHLPPKVRPAPLYLPASSPSRAAFSLDATTSSWTQLPRAAAGLPSPPPPPPDGRSTRYTTMIATSPTTTAMISGSGLRRLGALSSTTGVAFRTVAPAPRRPPRAGNRRLAASSVAGEGESPRV